ncbi:MAG: DNA topology modulation protein [Clostridia bacterium]|nr:DNA topology modulation protein [Clostridia bacterium]
MKIAILGYSGSGKSTLARILADKYNIDVLHFDAVHFLPDWEIRSRDEKERITREFLDSHTSWVIDGNYSKLFYERRMEEADRIILLLFNRFSCFFRAYGRYIRFRGKTRPDMAEGCREKFDLEFARWILFEGRKKSSKERYNNVITRYRDKVTVIRNQKQLCEYIKSIEKNN